MIRLHYFSWAGYALIAFMIMPVIRAQSDVINANVLKSAYDDGQREIIMSLPIEALGSIQIEPKKNI